MPRRVPRHPSRSGAEVRREILRVERLVAETLRTLPDPLRAAADELILVVEAGGAARDGTGDEIYGLFDGVSRGERSGYGDPPARITLYARTLVADFLSDEELAREVRRTVVHEIGHYLGLDEEDLQRRGLE